MPKTNWFSYMLFVPSDCSYSRQKISLKASDSKKYNISPTLTMPTWKWGGVNLYFACCFSHNLPLEHDNVAALYYFQ